MQNKSRAFTLIELLVVVLIIGILAAVAVPQYEKAVMKSRYATLMSVVDTLANAEEVYYLANGTYTNDFTALDVQPAGCTLSENKKKCTFDWGSCVLDAGIDGAVACVNTSTLQNGYAHYFKFGKYKELGRACWVFSSEEKYSKLCEQVGSTLKYESALCPPYESCKIYTFN